MPDTRIEPHRGSRMVLFRPGALGDALLAVPPLALLRAARLAAQITFVARGEVLPLLAAAGLVDTVYPYDLPAWAALFATDPAVADPLARQVVEGAEVIAWLPDPQGDVAIRLRALGAERAVVAPAQSRPGEPIHMALHLARALQPLGIAVPADVARLRELIPPLKLAPDADRHADEAWVRLALADGGHGVVALHPGSGGTAKRWPPDSFAALADAIRTWGLRSLLIEGPQDAEVCAAVQAATPLPLPVARELSIESLAALLRRCSSYVGNDSGVSHLAGLLDVPTLALFGPTDPAVWAPLGRRVHVLRSPDATMERLEVGRVADALRDLLGLGSA